MTPQEILRELLLAAPKASDADTVPKPKWPLASANPDGLGPYDSVDGEHAAAERYNRALTAACDWLIRNPD